VGYAGFAAAAASAAINHSVQPANISSDCAGYTASTTSSSAADIESIVIAQKCDTTGD